MGRKYDFKYIVIGSGPAGSTAALQLARAKKRVALIESHFFGGSNLNTRDVPFGVALDFSHHFARTMTYPELKNQEFTFSVPTIPSQELKAIVATKGNDKKPLEAAGVVCINGFAHFLDPHTIAVGTKKFTSEFFIIATGAHLKTPDITIQDRFSYLTPESAIKLRRMPQFVAIVGGGSTGCELASYFAELGSKVVIFEQDKHLLPREDKDVGDTISKYFTHELGVTVLPTCKVVALEQDRQGPRLIFRYNNTEKAIRPSAIVLATGSEPTTDLGLENAKVKYKPTGIVINKSFQTSAKHIYAIGDCIGGDSSTELAHYQGLTLGTNLASKSKNLLSLKGFIRLTNTDPEVAVVGMNEKAISAAKIRYRRSTVELSEITASKIHNTNYGFFKLLTDRTGHILGATIVSPHAGLLAQEISLAIRHNLTVRELASTPHLINDYSEAIRLAAKGILSKKR